MSKVGAPRGVGEVCVTGDYLVASRAGRSAQTSQGSRRRCPGPLSELEFLSVILTIDKHPVKKSDAARDLIRRYGSLIAVMNVPDDELASNPRVGVEGATNIGAVHRIIIQGAYAPLQKAHIFDNYEKLFVYLQWTNKLDGRERVRLLSLGPKCNLLRDEVVAEGTAAFVPLDSQTIVRHAIVNRAVSVILVHNHPSGTADPSKQDIAQTADLEHACGVVGITLLDHIVLVGGKWFSFREHGLVPRA